MKKSGAVLAASLATAMLAGSAFAEVTPANNTATTTAANASTGSNVTATSAQAVSPKLLEKIGVSYFGAFSGPSVGKPSSLVPDENGKQDPSAKINLVNYLTTVYKITPDVSAGATITTKYVPVEGQAFTFSDPNLRVGHKKIIHTDNFNLSQDLRLTLPFTRASHNRGLQTALATLQVANYDVPGTKLSVGTQTFAKFSLFKTESEGTNLGVYVTPYASYQFLPTLAGTLAFDTGFEHAKGAAHNEWAHLPHDLQIGGSWDVMPNLNVNPFLQLQTGGKVTLDSTMLGAFISAKLL